MSTVILIEADLISPEGQALTLRFADRAVRPFGPDDSARPNTAWDDRLIEPPTLRRLLFEDLASLRPGLGVGVMLLANGDYGLDAYAGHHWGEVRIWRWTEGTDFAEASPVFRAEAAPPSYGLSSTAPSRVRVSLFDARAELDRAAQAATFAGTNGEPGVLYEGDAGGLKGRAKPLAFGDLIDAHVPAVLVNAGARVYQLHDGPIEGPIELFDRGGPAGYADEGDLVGAAFDAALPDAASYLTDLGRGLIKLNGDPVGILTFGTQGDSAEAYAAAAGPLIARLLSRAGVAAERIGESVRGLNSGVCGIWAGAGERAADLTALLARSAAAALLPDRQGVWQAHRFGQPAAVESATIAADQILSLIHI